MLLLVSGVYYPVTVLPGWLQLVARASPATYVLEGMRQSLMQGADVISLLPSLVPLLIIGLLSIPVGLAIFGWAEKSAKRHGRLKRSG